VLLYLGALKNLSRLSDSWMRWDRTLFPVFYDVEQSKIDDQTKSYTMSLIRMKKISGKTRRRYKDGRIFLVKLRFHLDQDHWKGNNWLNREIICFYSFGFGGILFNPTQKCWKKFPLCQAICIHTQHFWHLLLTLSGIGVPPTQQQQQIHQLHQKQQRIQLLQLLERRQGWRQLTGGGPSCSTSGGCCSSSSTGGGGSRSTSSSCMRFDYESNLIALAWRSSSVFHGCNFLLALDFFSLLITIKVQWWVISRHPVIFLLVCMFIKAANTREKNIAKIFIMLGRVLVFVKKI